MAHPHKIRASLGPDPVAVAHIAAQLMPHGIAASHDIGDPYVIDLVRRATKLAAMLVNEAVEAVED